MNKLAVFGIILAVLAVLTMPAAAENVIFLEPSDISCGPGEEVTDVWVYLNATDGVTGFQIHLKYEDDVVDIVNITSAVKGTNPSWLMWDPYWKVAADGHHYLFVTGTMLASEVTGDKKELAKITLKCLNPGTRPLEFLTVEETGPAGDPTYIVNLTGGKLPYTHINGTFTCAAPGEETFTKDLVAGWNLVSLPLTPWDNSTSSVLSSMSGKYDAVYSYNAATKQFEDVTSGTMDPGVGYFVHVTSADTWTYTGMAKTSMSVPLEQGLNMVGWLNCSKSISDGLSSIDGNYYYVARWNAAEQKFETYNPVAPTGFNDFADMERGEGYFISMKTGDTLSESC